jgi:hypothetical protein
MDSPFGFAQGKLAAGSCEEIVRRANNGIAKLAGAGRLRM